MRDEGFYVGTDEHAPPEFARRLRGLSIGIAVSALVLAAVISSQQPNFLPGSLESDRQRVFEGWLRESPVPALLIAAPGEGAKPFALSSHLLVGPGKRGARSLVAGLAGRHARIRGQLAHLDGQSVIELAPQDAISPLPSTEPMPASTHRLLGEVTLRGEITDSRCHFGVMNPATGTLHRACAVECLRGGVPPVFLARSQEGGRLHLLVTGADGRNIGPELIALVAEPVEITAPVEWLDGLLVLRAEPEDFVRLD